METLFSAGNSIAIWGVVAVSVAVAIYLEQRTKWGGKFGAVVVCLALGLALANARVIPFDTSVHDSIYNYIMPLALVMMMYHSNLRKIFKESGKTFALFQFSIVGTIIGVFLCFFLFRLLGQDQWVAFWPGATASYIGGTVNNVAMQSVFDVSRDLVSADVLIGSFMLGVMIFCIKLLNSSKLVRKNFDHPHIDEFEAGLSISDTDEERNEAALYWKAKNISMLDIAMTIGTGIAILATSYMIVNWVQSVTENFFICQIFGSIYVMATLLTTGLATAFPSYFARLRGADELGTILLLTWFFAVGTDANFAQIIKNTPLVFVEFSIITGVNMLITALAAKYITKSPWEEAMTCSQASVGGPSTAVAQNIGFGWKKLIVPGVMVGLYGYVIGNYIGLAIGYIINAPLR